MRCFIAIDSGGTKTDAVLFEETGHILARSLTQGCNAMDIGIGSACESLLGVLQNLVARIPRDGTLVSIYSGVAATDYFGGDLGRYIRPYFPDVTMRVEEDAVNLISGRLLYHQRNWLIPLRPDWRKDCSFRWMGLPH